ncbi:metallophosphoesterase [Pseudomonas sp. N040]|uniref:metallophosphoesterase n=1 Tax=Pseudomonas sp. N040 TaxID=2785325 RepID=UPI0018A2A155|nr:metallophosphoesterase [Pseudomonas sp. N040]MBF7729284.1 metallophosphoesterase [Pseudomonas sp. N040]MBW7012924.1 metallophosphoesterase [Pseudomonas sp. N040]
MLLDPQRSYDLIGDVHGCAHTLERLLEALGYRQQGGVWRHPWRMALFLGDIIDRGPRIREALHLVHGMVEAGQAQCIMGNHEFNALGWNTPAPAGSGRQFVREHTPRNAHQLGQTHQQFAEHPRDWQDFLGWFYELPLLLDGGRFRVVHACWDAELIRQLRSEHADARVDQAFVERAAIPGSFPHRVFDRLLRGLNMRLPGGLALTGDDGLTRSFFRSKFWEDDPQTYGDIVFQPDALPEEVVGQALPAAEKAGLLRYASDEPLLFVGHYWRRGQPAPLRPNLACLDYSAVLHGKLVAYRLDAETRLEPHKFVWVEVEQPEAPL